MHPQIQIEAEDDDIIRAKSHNLVDMVPIRHNFGNHENINI